MTFLLLAVIALELMLALRFLRGIAANQVAIAKLIRRSKP